MATITNLIMPTSASDHLRPFDVRRDLRPTADLVELCFADTLDPDGERYLRQMRSAANSAGLLRWAAATAEWASVPLTGYIWEEDGKLVGNVSLITFILHGRRNYLIANVAVHPDFRRRGIARSLTQRAIEHARQRGAQSTWLHVREENDAAISLYRSLGYNERARRTTWFSQPGIPLDSPPADVTVGPRRARFWQTQKNWLKYHYPPELTWHLPINLNSLRPGITGFLYRILTGAVINQWAAQHGDRLSGVLSWQATQTYADTLWLASSPQEEDTAAFSLLLHARQHLSPRRPLSLDYPAHHANEAIQAAGFRVHQTLIWMEREFRR
jgi:ribosomal protein S18 acetylase RimI-like enzyme